MTDNEAPSAEIIAAFGAFEEPELLSGGQGQVWKSGNIVLKPAIDCPETNWIAEFYRTCAGKGFQLPEPVECVHGWVVHDGWQAWKFIPGEHTGENWLWKLELCRDFHQAIADVPMPEFFANRERTPWVVADHFVWGERELHHNSLIEPFVEMLSGGLRPVEEPSQLIHGDFGGNILGAPGSLPAVIDFSPYWRPAPFAAGVVVADAIVWEGADLSLMEGFGLFPDFYQYLLRAELRRIVELEMLELMYGRDVLGQIEAHIPLIEALS